jgi:hypothetical protein
VAKELISGRKFELWEDEFSAHPPFPLGSDTLFVAYSASAELGVHCVLGWDLPFCVLDLCAEFRVLRNHSSKPQDPYKLEDALQHFDLNSGDIAAKEWMHERVQRLGPWTPSERAAVLAACESDVDVLVSLFEAMFDKLDFSKALIRGRYMKAVARVEQRGIPIDVSLYDRVIHHRKALRRRVVDDVNESLNVFDNYALKYAKVVKLLGSRARHWPRTKTGKLVLDKDTLWKMGLVYPDIKTLGETKATLSALQKLDLPIGTDNRNRFSIRPFTAKTGRNAPRTSTFIFGQAVWFRSMVAPPPGYALVYADWSQQEFYLAGYLSRDAQMLQDYRSGDPYIAAAIRWGLAPGGATKKTHREIRDCIKIACLAILYGIQAEALGVRIGRSTAFAADILRMHHRTYKRYWEWVESLLDSVAFRREIVTRLGWKMRIKGRFNERSLGNYPMQATGGDLLRVGMSLAVEANLEIVAPVHDAFLMLSPLKRLDVEIDRLQACMRQAAIDVLQTDELRSDVNKILHPDRFMDKRGLELYHLVMEHLAVLETEEAAANIESLVAA